MKPRIGSAVQLHMGDRTYAAIVLNIVEDGSSPELPMLNLAHAKIDKDGNQTGNGISEVDLALSTFHKNDKNASENMHTWSFAFEPEDVELVLGITPAKDL